MEKYWGVGLLCFFSLSLPAQADRGWGREEWEKELIPLVEDSRLERPRISIPDPASLDSPLGVWLLRLVGGRSELLETYGIAPHQGRLVRLDLEGLEVIWPLQEATEEELRYILVEVYDHLDGLASWAHVLSSETRDYLSQRLLYPRLFSSAQVSWDEESIARLGETVRRAEELEASGDSAGAQEAWERFFSPQAFPPGRSISYLGQSLVEGNSSGASHYIYYLSENFGGGFRSLPFLERLLLDRRLLSSARKLEVVKSVERIGGPRATALLEKALRLSLSSGNTFMHGDYQKVLIWALHRQRPSGWVDLFGEVLDSEDVDGTVKENVAMALGSLFALPVTPAPNSSKKDRFLSLFSLRRTRDLTFELNPQDAPRIFSLIGRRLVREEGKGSDHYLLHEELEKMVKMVHLLGEVDRGAQQEFLSKVRDPGAIVATIALTRNYHARDVSEALFKNLEEDLPSPDFPEKDPLIAWLESVEPANFESWERFLWRMNEFGLLTSYLTRHPSFASAIVREFRVQDLYTDEMDSVRYGAILDNVFRRWPPAAKEVFLEALLSSAENPREDTGGFLDRLVLARALYNYYRNLLPLQEQARILKATHDLAPLDRYFVSGSVRVFPKKEKLRAAALFTDAPSHRSFLKFLREQGFQPAPGGSAKARGATALWRGSVSVDVYYSSLHGSGPEEIREKRYLEAQRELLKSSYDFVAFRGEPDEMPEVDFFKEGLGWIPKAGEIPHKVVLLGSCRTIGDGTEILKLCPDCQVVADAETGKHHFHNLVTLALFQAFETGEDWSRLGKRIEKIAARDPEGEVHFVGPWHFGAQYYLARSFLEDQEEWQELEASILERLDAQRKKD